MSRRPTTASAEPEPKLSPVPSAATTEKPLAHVFFVDVAQGASQVIQIGTQVIIIDCGESATPTLCLLSSLTFEHIDIVISHWHKDHVGGLKGIMDAHKTKIRCVHFAQTRAADELFDTESFDQFTTDVQRNEHIKVDCLRAKGKDPTLYAADFAETRVQLSCLFPSFMQAIKLQGLSDENAGSGVLLLECGPKSVLFPGDVGKLGLESIRSNFSGRSVLDCTICAAPHHTGKLGTGTTPGYDNPFEWLYEEVIRPEFLIVRVGTKNKHHHPNSEHLAAAKKRPIKIMCTQITTKCVADPERYTPSVLNDCHPSSACCHGNGVGCAGTVHAQFYPNRCDVKRWEEHQRAIDGLIEISKPACRL